MKSKWGSRTKRWLFYNTFEQHVEGDENTPGNVLIRSREIGLRKEIDYLRQQLIPMHVARGCRVRCVPDLYPRGYGYVITELDGRTWNLLCLERQNPDYDPGDNRPRRLQDIPVDREPIRAREGFVIHKPGTKPVEPEKESE